MKSCYETVNRIESPVVLPCESTLHFFRVFQSCCKTCITPAFGTVLRGFWTAFLEENGRKHRPAWLAPYEEWNVRKNVNTSIGGSNLRRLK